MATTQPGGVYARLDAKGKVVGYFNGKGQPIDPPKGAAKPAAGDADRTKSTRTEDDGKLPKDYPERERWESVNLTTRAALEGKTDAELVALPGIGTASVAKMREYAKAHPLPAS
ncbi:MAG TPA: hypothetical protein VFR37_10730 [Longimicrobium sp.]|nr:hypothetical protein [Longimicrobium sp.]